MQINFNPEAGTILSSPSPIVIASEDVVRYKAYDEIVLTNFETDGNADFIAEIIPCPEPHNVDDCGIFIIINILQKKWQNQLMKTL